ncbi:XRE family transcriptional regulator [Halalkalibaculum sp. DA3122]|uniref:XRE family transcriptional regulator n=1 Tax=Halalkalibaculum sp. DA3122 TaxID=3373607 RepID=UPI003754A6C5
MVASKIFAKRLKKIEEVLGKTPIEMAKMGKCSRATYYRYRNGETNPDIGFLTELLKSENKINIEWLFSGVGPILNLELEKEQIDNIPDFTAVPLYFMKPRKNDSEGSLAADKWESPPSTLPLGNYFLESVFDTYPEEYIAIRVQCDSMAPEVKPGSLVLVNRREANPTIDGIFIVRIDDVIRMKLVQRLPNNKIKLTTMNDKFDPIFIDLDNETNFEILGRIIWIGSPV